MLELKTVAAPEVAGADVRQGLLATPKTLPPAYFYDDLGSQLFEQICDLPEYYPTRTEAAILSAIASQLPAITGSCDLIELGSGSSTKTRLLLDAYTQHTALHYIPIDVSSSMLKQSALNLLATYTHNLRITALVGDYTAALPHLPGAERRLVLFLGSTLGNLTADACPGFLRQIRSAIAPGDYFLLGVDLHKDTATLEAAYNDGAGVTAAFNRNILAHLNWRFGCTFTLKQFEHWAFYNEDAQQIEMHLRSLSDQTIDLGTLNATLRCDRGETIRTEISRKFNIDTLVPLLAAQQLPVQQIWQDPQQWFGVLLCQAI